MAFSACCDEERCRRLSSLARIGWWEADFSTRRYLLSEYIRKLLGMSDNTISFNEFRATYLVEGHTARINTLLDLRPDGTEEMVFPLRTVEGVVWMRLLVGGRDVQSDGTPLLIGTMQRVASPPPSPDNRADRRKLLLDNIFDNILSGVELYDQEGIMLDINERDMKIFGIPDKTDVVGVNMFKNPNLPKWFIERLLGEGGAEAWLDYSFDKAGDYYPSEKRDAIKIYCRVSKVYDDKGEFLGYVSINSDNAELEKARVRISDFETLFLLISKYAKVGYAKLNIETCEGYSVEQWRKNMGENEEFSPMEYKDIYMRLHPDDREEVMRFMRQAGKNGLDKFTKEVRVMQPDGGWKWIRLVLMANAHKPLSGGVELLGVNYDITESKELEFKLIAAKEKAEEADRLKSAFLANMSHEIRTPLNAIVGFSSLLEYEQDEEDRKSYVKLIQSNNDLLLRLINDILDLSKIEAGTTEFVQREMDVNQLCMDIVLGMRLKAPAGVEIAFDRHLPQCTIVSDYSRLSQVVSNLVGNAVKFTKQGNIRIGYDRTRHGDLRFYVADTGVGIPFDKQQHVFDRFAKLDNFVQGTGLGLAICKSIVEHLGGTIGVDSEPGRGSCFWFELPAKVCESKNVPDEFSLPS